MRRYKQSGDRIKKIVSERIEKLLSLARHESLDFSEGAKIYVAHARRLSRKNKVPMPRGSSMLYCRQCGIFFIAGRNARVRTRKGRLVIHCLNCKSFRRFPFYREIRKSKDSLKQGSQQSGKRVPEP